MVGLQQKIHTLCCFHTTITKNPWIAEVGQQSTNEHVLYTTDKKMRKARVWQTLEPVVDVKLLVNMDSTSHGNPLVVSEEIVTTAESDITGVSQCPPDHEYALTSSHDNRTPLETVEIGIQTDVGMAEMTELLNIKEKSQNPDAVLGELFLQTKLQQMTRV